MEGVQICGLLCKRPDLEFAENMNAESVAIRFLCAIADFRMHASYRRTLNVLYNNPLNIF